MEVCGRGRLEAVSAVQGLVLDTRVAKAPIFCGATWEACRVSQGNLQHNHSCPLPTCRSGTPFQRALLKGGQGSLQPIEWEDDPGYCKDLRWS